MTEPPQRNSGVVGGTFLARKEFINPDTGKSFADTDFKCGATVRFSGSHGGTGYSFIIDDVDEATLRYMEGRPAKFPNSDISAVEAKLKAKLDGHSIRQIFLKYDTDHSGFITVDEFTKLLVDCTGQDIDPQSKITLMRVYDLDGNGRINYEEFRAGLGTGDLHTKGENYQAAKDADMDSYLSQAKKVADEDMWNVHKDEIIEKFVERFHTSGTMTANLKKIAGIGRTDIYKADFIKAVSQSKDSTDSDSWNMYLSHEEARFLADALFGQQDMYDIAAFAKRISNLEIVR